MYSEKIYGMMKRLQCILDIPKRLQNSSIDWKIHPTHLMLKGGDRSFLSVTDRLPAQHMFTISDGNY
jgi:hypothetical protein